MTGHTYDDCGWVEIIGYVCLHKSGTVESPSMSIESGKNGQKTSPDVIIYHVTTITATSAAARTVFHEPPNHDNHSGNAGTVSLILTHSYNIRTSEYIRTRASPFATHSATMVNLFRRMRKLNAVSRPNLSDYSEGK